MDHAHDPPGARPKWTMRRMVEKLANAISGPRDMLIGKEFDSYKIEEKVGHGGMANIYRASTASGERVALKVLNDDYCKMDKITFQFMSEALFIENISHPNIVRGLGHGAIDASRLYIAMEYIEGIDMDSHLKDGKMAPEEVMKIILDVCRGLEAVHTSGIIHRDLKPANIMLEPDGPAKLIDFGISRELSKRKKGEWDGRIYGTLNYVAPEQTVGDNFDPRSDIYSLGVSAYRAICGIYPIESDDLRELLELIRVMPPREPSEVVPGIPAEVDRIIMRALSKNPDGRFQSAREMAVEIEKFLIEA